MPLHCPHCQIVQSEDNETCINCGQPLAAAPAADLPLADPLANPADPIHAVQRRRASWQLPALVAVGLLLALVAAVLVTAKRREGAALRLAAARSQAPAPPAPNPPASGEPPLPAAPPLPAVPPLPTAPASGTKTAAKAAGETTPMTITLASTSAGRHVSVGENVTLTALARGQGATLTLFYRRGHREKTMIGFGQGSLWSGIWTPAAPGRYEFTATALGDHRQEAVSRPIEITVDKPVPQAAHPAPQVAAREKAAPAAPPRPRPLSPPPPRAAPPRAAVRAAPPASGLIYHVAAAQFSFSRSAVVLADALARRGYPAVPERMTDRHGKTVYVVVTGSYRRPKEARAAALALQRSGYPAYFYSGR